MESQISTELQILMAAEELFLNRGFAMTSTTEIAKKAGCNQALIHYYFRTKENLFIKLFETKFLEFLIAINPGSHPYENFKEKLKSIICAHLAMLAKNPKIPFLLINEITTRPERLKKIIENMKSLVIPVLMELSSDLKKEERRGTIREVDPFSLLFNIVSMNAFTFLARPLLQEIREFSDEEFELFIEERKEQIFDFVWNSIKKQ